MTAAHKPLTGKVALVTGASRGLGKGTAIGLGEAGATVYVTARTLSTPGALPGTAEQTAAEITAAGGNGIAVQCDHTDDAQVDAVFEQIRRDQGRLDVLVNCVYPAPGILPTTGPKMTGGAPFWQTTVDEGWEAAFTLGVRAHYVATQKAMPLLLDSAGLVVNISSPGNYVYIISTMYGMGKAANERMVNQMAQELEGTPVSIVTVWPGLVKTEIMGSTLEAEPSMMREILGLIWTNVDGAKDELDEMTTDQMMSLFESPVFSGRGVAALAADPNVKAKSGKVLALPALAEEYGFTDVDGQIHDGLKLLHTNAWPPLVEK